MDTNTKEQQDAALNELMGKLKAIVGADQEGSPYTLEQDEVLDDNSVFTTRWLNSDEDFSTLTVSHEEINPTEEVYEESTEYGLSLLRLYNEAVNAAEKHHRRCGGLEHYHLEKFVMMVAEVMGLYEDAPEAAMPVALAVCTAGAFTIDMPDFYIAVTIREKKSNRWVTVVYNGH